MNPCIIIHNAALERYEAYNEDGRRCADGFVWSICLAEAKEFGYQNTPLNSRLGRTIFDKLPLSVQMATRHG